MKLYRDSTEVFVPSGLQPEEALKQTTHLAIAAHQDDLEMMAASPILMCLEDNTKYFTGIVVTDGGDSPRGGRYKNFSDEEIRLIRRKEQKKAAVVGEYTALVLLDYQSVDFKGNLMEPAVSDLLTVLRHTQPEAVYTHNPADKHDTHVAAALGVIRAIREMPENEKPGKLYGCEVWRDLDWMLDVDKVIFDTSSHENLQAALLGVFDSQIEGGKRYDLAVLGRRRAHGTFFQSHEVDKTRGLSYAMDLTPLIQNSGLSIAEYAGEYIRRFAEDVTNRIFQFELTDMDT